MQSGLTQNSVIKDPSSPVPENLTRVAHHGDSQHFHAPPIDANVPEFTCPAASSRTAAATGSYRFEDDVLRSSPATDEAWLKSGQKGETLDHDQELASSVDKTRGAMEKSDMRTTNLMVAPTATSKMEKLPIEVLIHLLSTLTPDSLNQMALVSKYFRSLVTTPYAWRSAFAQYFPGMDLAAKVESLGKDRVDDADSIGVEKRYFTRLTTSCTWKSEYIMRTQLLHALIRGRPSISSGGRDTRISPKKVNPTSCLYHSTLDGNVTHLDALFGTDNDPSVVKSIHGCASRSVATMSDPSLGKLEDWNFRDLGDRISEFSVLFPNHEFYGLGEGDIVGQPNLMDVSHMYGLVLAEGFPGGRVFFRHSRKGRYNPYQTIELPLREASDSSALGSVSSVWIAKANNIPNLSDDAIGIICGSSQGVISTYSLGSRFRRYGLLNDCPTARWILSPGIPIVAIAVDETYTLTRQAQNRIWAVALNALGEVFYISKFPRLENSAFHHIPYDEDSEALAWKAGRTTYWGLIEASRRVGRNDPFHISSVDGSYSPRSSWNGMCLSVVQVESERREIERFLLKTPKDFRNACIGWDMRRRLEVDFGGSATGFAGESVVVFDCGMAEGMLVAAKRYSRAKTTATPMKMISSAKVGDTSLERLFALFDLDSIHSSETAQSNIPAEDWLVSKVSFASRKVHQITATSMDTSINALRTAFEDITSNHGESSEASSPVEGRCSPTIDANRLGEVPGQRARLLAAGTSTGYIFLWNIRPSINGLHGEQVICPTRIIRTNSPGISSLAMSALYLVHGGSDGLIQAWDPLASSGGPVRTLKSRSTLVRRQRDRSEARPMRSNLRQPLPVTAIRLDPDVMRLRGIAACGPYIRYWNFSSSEASQREGSRQRKAKGYRHESNLSATYGSFPLTRVGMRGYIAAEQVEHERDEADQVKRNRYMQGRYGVGMGTDDEMLAYATMLSKDSFSESSQQQLDAENAGAAVQASSSRDALSLLHGEDQLSGTSFSPDITPADLLVAGPRSTLAQNQEMDSVDIPESEDPDLQFVLQLSLAELESQLPSNASSTLGDAGEL